MTKVGKSKTAQTLEAVAKLAGVSEMTVSRVLSGKGSFSNDARSKVEAAVLKSGYVPNKIAGSLASSRSTQVAVIVPTIGNIVFTEVLAGISSVLAPAGLQAVLGVTDYDLVREEALVEALLSWRPRAVIIAGLEHTPATVKRLKHSGIPVVQIMDIDGDVIDRAVGFSQVAAGAAIAAHFLERGFRRIGYAGTDLTLDTRAAKRLAGFVAALEKAGVALVADCRTPLPTSLESGAEALIAIRQMDPTIEAVYFSNDDMAVGALLHCQRAKIRVPEDVAIAGFNGLSIGQALPTKLTSIRSPRVETGEQAARAVLSYAAGKQSDRILDLGFVFLRGESS